MSIIGINVIDGNKLVFRDELTYITPERRGHFVTCYCRSNDSKCKSCIGWKRNNGRH